MATPRRTGGGSNENMRQICRASERPKLVTYEENGDGNEICLETEAKTKQQNGAPGQLKI
jgi:hypothetical protein